MTSQFGLNDASRIIDVIDGRIQKHVRSGAKIDYTWGKVAKTFYQTAMSHSPAGYWRMHGTADASGFGQTLTAQGDPRAAVGLIEDDPDFAVMLDGNDYYTVTGPNLYQSDWTIFAITTPTSITGWNPVVGDSSNGVTFGIAGGTLKVSCTSVSDAPEATGFTPVLYTQYSLAASYSYATKLLTYYVDGAKISEHTYDPPWTNTPIQYVGASHAGTNKLSGLLDEVIVYKSVLDAGQIRNLHSAITSAGTVSVVLGDDLTPNQGFRVPATIGVSAGDTVRVAIDHGTGERWIAEKYSATSSPIITPKHARNLLPNGGFRHFMDGWNLVQNGDTTASVINWTSDITWTLRDGDTPLWSPSTVYGSSVSIMSTSTGEYYPHLMSDAIPVMSGVKYSLSALVGTHRTSGVNASLWFYDRTGALTGSFDSEYLGNDDSKGGGSWLSGWRRITMDGIVAPDTSTYVKVALVLTTPYASGTDMHAFWDQVMLTQSDYAVEYQPYEDVSIYKKASGQVGVDEFLMLNARNSLTVGNGLIGAKGTYTGHTADYIMLLYEDSTAGGVLQFGLGDSSGSRDVNLFRGAANVLKTDDIMHAVGGLRVSSPTANDGQNWEALRIIMPNNGYTGIAIYDSPSATQPVFRWAGYGGMEFGPGGSTAIDTYFYRSAAGVLYSDGQISVNTLKTRANGVQNLFVGDDASIGDVNVAHILGIKSQTDANYGGIQLGADTNLFRESADWLRTNDNLYVDGVVRWISETWTSVSFTNSWVDYGSYPACAYRKDANGYVHLRGLMKSGTLGSSAFTLPTGYRPSGTLIFQGRSNVTSTWGVANAGRLDITSTGTVVPHSSNCNNGYVTLEGIVYLAEG